MRETAPGGECPTVNSKDDDASRGDIYKHINIGKDDFIAKSFPGIYKNMLFCFVFGIKTYFHKRRVHDCLFILTTLWADITKELVFTLKEICQGHLISEKYRLS